MSTNGHSHSAPPILLTIAGFDPSCGAGTAADLKTFAAHGCYGVAAITSLTVQNTQGVETVHNTPSAELRAQLEALAKDCDIAAVKIGMLGNRGNAVVVAEFLDAHKFAHVVHDPVMKSSSGAELLDAAGIKFVAAELLKRASVITPNVPEAEVLTGLTIKDVADMESATSLIVNPVRTSASGTFGVMTLARFSSSAATNLIPAASRSSAPLEDFITGSCTTCANLCASRNSATTTAFPRLPSIPIFTAAISQSLAKASSCARSSALGVLWTVSTPWVFWTVSEVIAATP